MHVLLIIIIFLSFNLKAETKEILNLSCQSETYELNHKTEIKKEKFNQIFIFEILINTDLNKEKENLTLATIITESVPSCYKYEGSSTDSIIKMKCTKDVPGLEVLFGEQFLRINRITGKFNKISKSELGITTIAGTCKKAEALF